MTPPLVSAIVPVYNGARYLPEAVESVLAQDYAPVEVVVVDDGSTDASAEVAAQFDGVRLVQQENQGHAAARNRGVAESRGTLLAFLDADDRWRPTKLTRQVEHLVACPEANLVLGLMETFLEPGMEQPNWLNPAQFEAAMPGFLPSALMVRRSFFEAVGPFDETLAISCDSDWLLRARAAGDPGHVLPDVVLDRRIHPANQTQQAACTAELLDVIHGWVMHQKRRPATS